MSGGGPIDVASWSVLLSGVPSPPPLTDTVLTALVAPGRTSTRNTINGKDAPGARVSERRLVTIWPDITEVHPSPVADTGTKPAGT